MILTIIFIIIKIKNLSSCALALLDQIKFCTQWEKKFVQEQIYIKLNWKLKLFIHRVFKNTFSSIYDKKGRMASPTDSNPPFRLSKYFSNLFIFCSIEPNFALNRFWACSLKFFFTLNKNFQFFSFPSMVNGRRRFFLNSLHVILSTV